MPELRVSVVLPYYLRLDEGDYQTAQAGETIRLIAPILLEGTVPRTSVRSDFNPADSADSEVIEQLKMRCCKQLMRRINRLLRWYRSVTRRAEITELTRAQVSPFQFEAIGPAPREEWTAPLVYEAAAPQPAGLTLEQTTQAVRAGLAAGNDPDVADLFLLDAERALHQGRFRETVLFSWSTIDSVFNRRFNALADVALAREWSDARAFFKGFDFGLRNKMSLGMRVVANRSLHGEPDGLWEKVSNSYATRNRIIHEGQNATEDDALRAMDVARQIVRVMREV